MTRELPGITAKLADKSSEHAAEDIRLQIDLRLRRDELDVKVEELRHTQGDAPTNAELVRLACRIYDARRARDEMLERELFGEPAWDMLLALYCLPSRGERLIVSGLCQASGVSQTTALRMQRVLIDGGLIERYREGEDKRLIWVRLSEKGRVKIEDYLLWLFDFEHRGVRCC